MFLLVMHQTKKMKTGNTKSNTKLKKTVYYSEYGIGIKPKEDSMERIETTIYDNDSYSFS